MSVAQTLVLPNTTNDRASLLSSLHLILFFTSLLALVLKSYFDSGPDYNKANCSASQISQWLLEINYVA